MLGGDAGYESLHLRRHAHSLGYGGHFLSKSRRYSTTLGALRAARQEWRKNRARTRVDPPTVPFMPDGSAVGIGWTGQGEATWVEAQRRRREDERRCATEYLYSRGPSELPGRG